MSYSRWQRLLSKVFRIDRKRRIPESFRPRLDKLEDRLAPTISITPVPASFIEGNVATASVLATFTDTTPGMATDYQAVIDWGDLSPTTTVTPSLVSGTFTVDGSHNYADETPGGGPHTATVTVTETLPDMDTASTSTTASVADAPLTPNPITIVPTETVIFTGPVGTFDDANSNATTADFSSLTIDWGDGTIDSGAAVAISGSAGGPFTISGSHNYAEDGPYAAIATAVDDGGEKVTIVSTANVAEGDLTLAGAPITATEGMALTNVTVATISDPGSPDAASNFSATIDWGDGTTDTVTPTGTTGSGSFTVNGTHTYADEFSGNINVTVVESDANFTLGPIAVAATVNEADVLATATSQPAISAVEGTTFNGNVAVFTDTGNPTNPASDFTATIDWGDGTADTGIVPTGSPGGPFTVSGSHLYAEEATRTIVVSLADNAPGTATATVTQTATVTDAPLRAQAAPTLSATEGASSGSVVLATFTDANPGDHTSDFSAAINWGDGTAVDTTTGSVSFNAGIYTLMGSHTYAEDGTYFASVRITDVGGFSVDTGIGLDANGMVVTASSSTAGAWYPDRFPPNGFVGGQTAFGRPGVIVETISSADANGNRPAGFNTGFYDYQGRIYNLPGGTTYVTMDLYVPATYASLNQQDPPPANPANFGSVASLWGTAVDATNTPVGNPIIGFNNLGTNNGNTGSAGFQVFDSTNGWTNVPGFTGYDQWYQLSYALSGGHFAYYVNGVLVYTDTTPALATAVSISNEILQGYNGGTATAVTYTIDWSPVQNTQATIAESGDLQVTGSAISATEGTSFSGQVAIVTDTGTPDAATDYTATIDWGDGTTDTGIAPTGATGGPFTVSGTHTYADEGSFAPVVTITETGITNGTASGTGTATVAEGDTLTPINNSNVSFAENTFESGFVAQFTDTNSNSATDFTATIDWGDGTSTTGVTPTGPTGGPFTVTGSHTYADEGNYTITTVMTDDAPGTASATSSFVATVTEADNLGGGTILPTSVAEGSTTSFDVATFTNTGYPTNPASDFTATIDWGDGTIDSGAAVTITSDGAGNLTVAGSHAYADEGASPTITVTIADDAPGASTATATGTVTVTEADTLTATPTTVNGTEGVIFTGQQVATFTDTNTSNVASDFTALILWGDGTSSVGVVSGGSGSFTVTGDHIYFDEGTFTPTVFVSDNAPGTATATAVGSALVSEADAISGTASAFSATEGSAFSGPLATFTNSSFPSNPASDFTATIDWGDGTSSTGTVVGGGAGTYLVSGDHTYADEGTFTVTVTLADDVPGSASASATATATVLEGDFGSTNAMTITPTEGVAFSGAVATIIDVGNPAQVASDFTASIDWGDSVTTPGTLSGPTGGPFTISGTHTYADEGSFTVLASFVDDPPGFAGATITSTATVSEADTLAATGTTISAIETNAFTGDVATFTDTNTTNVPGDFTATIDWGDGTSSTGTITGSSGSFTVSDSHTYTEDGSFSVSVTVADDAPGTASATASSVAKVAEGNFVLSGAPITATEGTAFSGTVATFSDPGSPDAAGNFSATIDWGDGTTDAGTITGSGGDFTVSGSHTYADEGAASNISVTVKEIDANFTIGPNPDSVSVVEGDTLTPTPLTFTPTEGLTSGAIVGAFSDSYTANTAADFTATIDWGDGTVTAGVVTGGSGSFFVLGNHSYTDEGSFPVTVTVTDDSPGTATVVINSTAVVAENDQMSVTSITVPATEGATATATAIFHDTFTANSSADFTAAIRWGDGATDSGAAVTITDDGAGNYTVTGTHIYADEGPSTVDIILTDDAPGTASATASTTTNVAEADALAAGTATFTNTQEGTATTASVLFTNTNLANTSADFTASIDWGDGTTDTGAAVTITDDGAGNYTVSGTHSYVDEGSFTATVVLADDAPGTASATSTTSLTIDENDTLTPTASTITGTEQTSFTGTVATFTDNNTTNVAADFTATIDWGDGTTTDAGTVSGSAGNFTVSGTHKYVDEGSYSPIVTVVEDGTGTATTSVTSTANIADNPLTLGTTTQQALIAGIKYNGLFLGSFTDFGDPSLNEPNDGVNYRVDVAWGDGMGDPGTITFDNGLKQFVVTGSHTYGHEGFYTITLTIHHGTAPDLTGTAKVSVADAPVFFLSFTTPPSQAGLFSGVVSRFTDYDSSGVSSDFAATIAWGDGAVTLGTVIQTGVDSLGHPNFEVIGTHSYAGPQTSTFAVTIQDLRGSTMTSQANDGQGALESIVYFDVATGTYKLISFRY